MTTTAERVEVEVEVVEVEVDLDAPLACTGQNLCMIYHQPHAPIVRATGYCECGSENELWCERALKFAQTRGVICNMRRHGTNEGTMTVETEPL